MEGYNLSVNAYKTSKSYGMKAAEYLIYADLRAAGWSQRDAWMVAFQGKGITWNKAELEREMNKLESLGSVQKRIAEQQEKKSSSDGLSPEELAKATSKEQILTDLVIAQRKAKYGSPEWLKIVASIADYNKIKQDEIDTESSQVHYYLPCNFPTGKNDCILFKNGLCK